MSYSSALLLASSDYEKLEVKSDYQRDKQVLEHNRQIEFDARRNRRIPINSF